jgi:hypothetical protein
MGPALAASGSTERPPVVKPEVIHRAPDGGDGPATLPFTGADVTAYALAGCAAIGAGTVLVRRTRVRSARH